MTIQYSAFQLDALRELANIGSGTASSALSSMLGRAIDISVPKARVLPFADAVEATGHPESEVTGIVLGVEPDSELAASALGEIGNVVGTSYVNALASMAGLDIEPTPPATATDMLGALVASVLAGHANEADVALMLDSALTVEGEDCSVSFLLVPDQGGVELLLSRLGLG